ncbi:uncharacterized protein LOC125753490 [Canis lupus dingo]|uniref:uncharacterized protein LOC125753490 n=1 Tax=Canis lupus dingo TaxID=286419 RepID=UPI0020C20499|nr:uncharacterized protein LOC125753490 [Canis lupus dingo]
MIPRFCLSFPCPGRCPGIHSLVPAPGAPCAWNSLIAVPELLPGRWFCSLSLGHVGLAEPSDHRPPPPMTCSSSVLDDTAPSHRGARGPESPLPRTKLRGPLPSWNMTDKFATEKLTSRGSDLVAPAVLGKCCGCWQAGALGEPWAGREGRAGRCRGEPAGRARSCPREPGGRRRGQAGGGLGHTEERPSSAGGQDHGVWSWPGRVWQGPECFPGGRGTSWPSPSTPAVGRGSREDPGASQGRALWSPRFLPWSPRGHQDPDSLCPPALTRDMPAPGAGGSGRFSGKVSHSPRARFMVGPCPKPPSFEIRGPAASGLRAPSPSRGRNAGLC